MLLVLFDFFLSVSYIHILGLTALSMPVYLIFLTNISSSYYKAILTITWQTMMMKSNFGTYAARRNDINREIIFQ